MSAQDPERDWLDDYIMQAYFRALIWVGPEQARPFRDILDQYRARKRRTQAIIDDVLADYDTTEPAIERQHDA